MHVPTAISLDITDARKQFNSLDKRLKDAPVLYVTRHGNQAFAVIDIDYLKTLMETIEVLSDSNTMQMLNDSLEDIKAGRTYDQEDLEDELL